MDRTVLRHLLAPDADDTRVVEVTKLAILTILEVGHDVSRNAIRRAAATVSTPRGRRAGIAKSTLDRNKTCRALFEAASAHAKLKPPRATTRVDAHVARMTRAALNAQMHGYRRRGVDRRTALDSAAARLASFGKHFDMTSLEPLVTARDRLRACRPGSIDGGTKRSSRSSRRSVSLVRRAIARIRSTGGLLTRQSIVAATAQFNKGVPISDATIDRNRECASLVDGATGRTSIRLPPAPNHLRHRELADGVMAERAIWRETRRLAFRATRLLAEHEDAGHRAEAASRADGHYASVAARDRIISASSAAITRAAPMRERSPVSTT